MWFKSVVLFKDQDYDKLRKEAQSSGQLFTDPTFPANKASIGGNAAGIEWKRPKDIAENPSLFVDGVTCSDLNQGELGNCWFVAACSCLATNKEIWRKVIPNHKDQEWDPEKPEKYAGIYYFRFWRFGEWTDVVIDDLLPTRNGDLVYAHSKDRNEFWSALLEKAYAKLYGSYESLDGGELAEALEDFTGGVSEPLNLVDLKVGIEEEARNDLYKVMRKAMDNHAMMAAAIPSATKEEQEEVMDMGLVKGHAYGITAVKRIALEGTGIFNMFNKEKIAMIRLRNPWGGTEWKGAFSDESEEWKKIDKESREKIGLTFDDDGEFWMNFEDYCKHFTNMSICRVINTSLFSFQTTWTEACMHGEWVTPHFSGGCVNNKETFLKNPQYVFDVDDNDDECLFQLTQKCGRGGEGIEKTTIGFSIMKVEYNRKYRVHQMQRITKSSAFKNSRGIFLRHTLDKGRYVIVACTFEPNVKAKHLLRVYTTGTSHAHALVKDKPSEKTLSCLPWFAYPSVVTRVTIIRARDLEKQDTIGGADPYCQISCEGHHYKTSTIKDTVNPEWNSSYIFYRRNHRSKPIEIEIWNSNALKNTFMGRQVIPASTEETDKIYEMTLLERENSKDKTSKAVPGKIFLQITTSTNLELL